MGRGAGGTGKGGLAGTAIPEGWRTSSFYAVPTIERTVGNTTVRVRQSGVQSVVSVYRDGYRGELWFADQDEAVARGNRILEEGLGAMVV